MRLVIYACARTRVCACTHVCACMCRPEVSFKCYSLEILRLVCLFTKIEALASQTLGKLSIIEWSLQLTLLFKNRVLSLGSGVSLFCWLAGKSQGPSCYCLPKFWDYRSFPRTGFWVEPSILLRAKQMLYRLSSFLSTVFSTFSPLFLLCHRLGMEKPFLDVRMSKYFPLLYPLLSLCTC